MQISIGVCVLVQRELEKSDLGVKGRRWRSRQLNRLLPDWDAEKQRAYTGSNGTTYKIGRAVPLRRVAHEKFKELTELREHHGPYLPIVIEACRDNQLSYEHVTGAVTHGAFTYALMSEFKKPAELSFRKLEARVTRNLKGLGLDQHPQIVGPKIVLENPIIKWGQADDKLVTPQPAGAAPAIRDWQKA